MVGAPPRGASLLDELERVLTVRQELVLRVEALEGERGEVAGSERAASRHDLVCHASAVDRFCAALGDLAPPDGTPVA